MAKMIKFYDVVAKKAVMIPESKTTKVIKKTAKRTTKFLVAKGAGGNKLYRIIG
jgi:hypothetical protein